MRLSLSDLPLVERLAVAEREARHEFAAIQGECLVECRDAWLTCSVRLVLVSAGPTQRCPEAPQVELSVVICECH